MRKLSKHPSSADRPCGLSFWRDESGVILVQFTVYVVAILGMIGLTLDGARFLLLNNDLQDLADAAALAGARDLDGSPNALNAINDATNFAAKNNVHWYDVSGLKIQSAHVYATFAAVQSGANTDNDPRQANYIKVTTGAWGVAPTLLRAVNAVATNSTAASAVAQSTTSSCIPTQMMMCNPFELTNGEFPASTKPGQAFTFSQTGNTQGYSPGDFNLVDTPSGGSSSNAIEQYLSQQSASSCTNNVTSGITPAQGQKTNATILGINVRFDQKPTGNAGDDLTPAPIKIDGWYVPGQPNQICTSNTISDQTPSELNYGTLCSSSSSSSQSCGLPADPSSTLIGSTTVGAGVKSADLVAYWANHHGAMTAANLPFDPTYYAANNVKVPTRYQTYLAENNAYVNVNDSNAANSNTLATTTPWLTDSVEPHSPPVKAGSQCLKTPYTNPSEFTASRRLMTVAVVDCNYWNVHGNAVNNIPIYSYSDFFVTNPSDTTGNIFTEYVTTHSIGAGNATGLHQVVRLVQ